MLESFARTVLAPTDPATKPRMVQTAVCPEDELWHFAAFAAFHNLSTPLEIRLELIQEANPTNAKNVSFRGTRTVGDGQPFAASQSLGAVTAELPNYGRVHPGYRLRGNFPGSPPGTQLTCEFALEVWKRTETGGWAEGVYTPEPEEEP